MLSKLVLDSLSCLGLSEQLGLIIISRRVIFKQRLLKFWSRMFPSSYDAAGVSRFVSRLNKLVTHSSKLLIWTDFYFRGVSCSICTSFLPYQIAFFVARDEQIGSPIRKKWILWNFYSGLINLKKKTATWILHSAHLFSYTIEIFLFIDAFKLLTFFLPPET